MTDRDAVEWPKPSDECDICGKRLSQHNMGNGLPMCGIYPTFRLKPRTPPPASEANEAMVDAAMKAFGDTELVGHNYTRRAMRAALVAALKGAAQ